MTSFSITFIIPVTLFCVYPTHFVYGQTETQTQKHTTVYCNTLKLV